MDQQATHGVGGAAYSLLRHQTISTALSLPHHAIFLGDCADPRSDGLDDETSSSLDSNSNGNNFYYSKPIMVLDLIWNLAFVAVSVAVLFSASRERPSTPLRVWVSGYSLQCLLHVGFVYFPYQKRMRTDHDNGDGGSVSNEGLPYLQTHSRISPHSILFPDQDAHQLSQCVFGYICFVHDHTSGKDKLQPKSIKCVFLGYSRLQKGTTLAPDDSCPPSSSPIPVSPSTDDATPPIAIRKGWCNAMVEEMTALYNNDTWDLVPQPKGKSTVGYQWVYTVKVGFDC
ncbi:uncharacterized protein LOC110656064 isoform X12 [Hevea brasiliensis]|uniref:uncharacterized protein LOC110656064 isoform X12 n=1 Tax=Hevea brasiliensis TaxID=3981 RepID=UPI002600FF02|nr:uncharacterized protein LOC110656064 isoform X12 [Hevea brasiliensis]